MAIIAHLRQYIFPKEFRIAAPAWPPDVLAALSDIAAGISPDDGGSTPADNDVDEIERLAFIADVGTGLWRLQKKLVEPDTGQPREGVRRAFLHLQSVLDVLSDNGFHIQDHTGEAVPEGGSYGLNVLTYDAVAGLTREKVVETIKPSVFYRDELIQMGEVIVGTPERPETSVE